MTGAELITHLSGVTKSSEGWMARCPAHDDKHASLGISEGNDGKLLLKCHAGCEFEAILAAVPHTNSNGSRIIAEYDYRDESGNLRYQSVRFEPKDFRGRKPDGNGGWEWKLNGASRVLYRLPELLAADLQRTVLIVEGEKDADSLAKLGLIATTNIGGAGKWRTDYNEPLRGRKVAIFPDADEPGSKHAQQVAESLYGIASSVKVVELPDLPYKGDVSDWLNAGNGIKELRELVDATTLFELKRTGFLSASP